jgi:DNA-binding MarR family transcriptional regulator
MGPDPSNTGSSNTGSSNTGSSNTGSSNTGPTAPAEAVRALARASRLLERASGEVSLAHYRVLAAIASGDQRASRIASKLALGKPTVSASVESLCQQGLLGRSEVAGDQRAAALELTAEGERWLAGTESGMTEWLQQICARTPDGAQVVRALVWMGKAIEEVAAERHAGGR